MPDTTPIAAVPVPIPQPEIPPCDVFVLCWFDDHWRTRRFDILSDATDHLKNFNLPGARIFRLRDTPADRAYGTKPIPAEDSIPDIQHYLGREFQSWEEVLKSYPNWYLTKIAGMVRLKPAPQPDGEVRDEIQSFINEKWNASGKKYLTLGVAADAALAFLASRGWGPTKKPTPSIPDGEVREFLKTALLRAREPFVDGAPCDGDALNAALDASINALRVAGWSPTADAEARGFARGIDTVHSMFLRMKWPISNAKMDAIRALKPGGGVA